jgi:hypothetical protein
VAGLPKIAKIAKVKIENLTTTDLDQHPYAFTFQSPDH